MRKKAVFYVVAIALVVGLVAGGLSAGLTLADPSPGAPEMINYQGLLLDLTTGDPVADGDYEIVFSIYDVDIGGMALWSEPQTVAVEGGLFSVLLGSVKPLSPSVFDGSPRYLGIKVEADLEMTPRQVLASVPYALQADTLDGLDASDLEDLYVNESGDTMSGSTAGALLSVTNTGTGPGVYGEAGNAGDVENYGGYFVARGQQGRGVYAKATGTNAYAGYFEGDVHVTDNVGIGTTSPEFKLSIDGGILADGAYGSGETLSASGAGTKLIWYPRKSAFRAGDVDGDQWDDVNIGAYSVALGRNTTASGWGATVGGGEGNMASYHYATVGGGFNNEANDWGATVSGGSNNEASDMYATVSGGFYNEASGASATVSGGDHNKASASYATVCGGKGNNADAYASTAIGQYNVGGGTSDAWVETDPIFEIGIGQSVADRANAVTILKNGDVHITGDVTIEGGIEVGTPRHGETAMGLANDAQLLAAGYVQLEPHTPYYSPGSHLWQPTSLSGSPSARYYHTAVWTGTEMIVWGGLDGSGFCNTGGRYDPATDTWTATSTSGAPSGRRYHTAVWTGSEMIVWGGNDASGYTNHGGRYNPATDTWSPITSVAPSAREEHTAIWTGTEMIVWGGYDASGFCNTGGRYDPATDTWASTSTSGAPSAREYHTAVWTGSEMIVWGGGDASGAYNTGGRYDPATDTWTPTSTSGAPSARYDNTAIWTGSEMIVWGGRDGSTRFNTGGRYNPATDTWSPMTNSGAPSARYDNTAIWTGSEMIVWGGWDGFTRFNTGGRYNPATDTWSATTPYAPSARDNHTAVWTGSEMIVWGGWFAYLNTGGRYQPPLYYYNYVMQ